VSLISLRKLMYEVARGQHGVVTRGQLLRLGMSASAIRDRVVGGELRIAAAQTYVLPGTPTSVVHQMAIAVYSRPRAIISGRSAAWLLGFDGVACPADTEITVPSTASSRSRVAQVRRSQHFANIGVVELNGLPCANTPETIFRMAHYVPPARIVRFLDAALLADADCAVELGEIYLRHQGERMKGMARLRPLLLERLDDEHVANESELEELADQVFVGLEAPPIKRQVPIPWAPTSGRVDRFIPEWGLILELDGRRWHARTEAFETDRIRDNAAVANGYSVLRFTWKMLRAEPERCRQLILAAGERLSPAADSSVVLPVRNTAAVSTTDS
jgi:very-short-patch-repair endonuclease